MRIFVGNITFTTTEDELSQLFEPYGLVERVQIITDPYTERSRGFGFVEMPDATEAQAAIAGLQGATLAGQTLTIHETYERKGEEGSYSRGECPWGAWPPRRSPWNGTTVPQIELAYE
jgi:RNA recognition motif-containing protein